MDSLSSNRWRRAWRWVLRTFYFVVLLLILNSLWDGWSSIQGTDWNVKPLLLFTALTLSLVYFIGRGMLWVRTMRSLDLPLQYGSGTAMFLQSYVARYLPGGFWPFVSIAASGQAAGLSKRVSVFVLVIDIAMLFWTSSLFGLPLLYLLYPEQAVWLIPALGILLALSLILSPFWLRIALKWSTDRGWLPDHLNLARFTSIQNIFQLLGGMLVLQICALSSYLTGIGSLIEVGLEQTAYLALAYSFAWFVGLIILFVPQGVGVREGVFVLLSSVILAPPVVVALAIAMRLLTVMRDLVILIYLVVGRPNRQQATPTTDGEIKN